MSGNPDLDALKTALQGLLTAFEAGGDILDVTEGTMSVVGLGPWQARRIEVITATNPSDHLGTLWMYAAVGGVYWLADDSRLETIVADFQRQGRFNGQGIVFSADYRFKPDEHPAA